MAMIYGIEFAMAQTPNRMRGIMMGLMLIMFGWSTLGTLFLLGYSTCSKHSRVMFYSNPRSYLYWQY